MQEPSAPKIPKLDPERMEAVQKDLDRFFVAMRRSTAEAGAKFEAAMHSLAKAARR